MVTLRGTWAASGRLARGALSWRQFADLVLRAVRPHGAVRRSVQGVDLVLPRAHRLPDYADRYPAYGQSLVDLAAGLSAHGPFAVIDVGANIGDSALQVLRAAPEATVVCVEGDPEWLPWLHRNVDADDRVEIVPALLAVGPEEAAGLTAVRHRGTTRFVPGAGDPLVQVNVGDLPTRHDGTAPMRLIKSDTDGHDTTLMPALAATYAKDKPVLYFEYDEELTRLSGHDDPEIVVAALHELGYRRFFAWDNLGGVLGHFEASQWSDVLRLTRDRIGAGTYQFIDVAAAHDDDPIGQDVLHGLGSTFVLP